MFTQKMIDLYHPEPKRAKSPYPEIDECWFYFLMRKARELNMTKGRVAKIVFRPKNTLTLSVYEFQYSLTC